MTEILYYWTLIGAAVAGFVFGVVHGRGWRYWVTDAFEALLCGAFWPITLGAIAIWAVIDRRSNEITLR